MKSVKGKKTKNKFIIVLLIIVLGTGILTNTSYAVNDTENGGTLFDPIMKFVTFLCDSLMQFMQNTFTSSQSIDNGDGTYTYQYSPAIIFSGDVQGLDINFIDPNPDVRNTNNFDAFVRKNEENYLEDCNSQYNDNKKRTSEETYKELLEQAEKKVIEGKKVIKKKTAYTEITIYYYEEVKQVMNSELQKEEKNFLCIEFFVKENKGGHSHYRFMTEYKKYEYEITPAFMAELNAAVTYTSIADELQPTIASWYNALRRISLVGLLSVLLYVGIRIVLTSIAGKENSKYKKMLKDWLVALCLLFTLHYIMSLTLVVTNEVSDIFNIGTEDVLLSDTRNNIENATSWGEAITLVIMYVVLTIFTVTFTFQYLKRVLYMAFFTLIAPLITLTYPIDKISDGKAQAFSMWLREYIFNALIQVIHLVIYYVLVESALSLVKLYPIYAIVAIGFMVPAEKIIRSMFGFNNSQTIGTLGAAATGGLIANAMNKLKSMPKIPTGDKGGSSKGGSNNNVRTASKNPLSSIKGNSQSSASAPGANNLGGNTKVSGTKSSNEDGDLIGGATSLLGKYHRKIGGAALGAFLGGSGAIIGFSAGVSQGDMGAALGGAVAGGAAGYNLGGRAYNGVADLPGNVNDTLNEIGDTWNEGAYGEEYANNVRFDREFRRSSTYKALRQKYGDNFSDEDVQEMLEAGITDKGAMEKILDNNEGNINEAIAYYTLAKNCPDEIYYDKKMLKQFCKDLRDKQIFEHTSYGKIKNIIGKYR